MVITSVNNDYVKEVNKLHQKKYRDEKKMFIIEGDHLIDEAYKNGYLKEIITLEDNNVKYDNVKITYVTKDVINKISDQTSGTNIIGICDYINTKKITNNLIILDGLQDPGNLGTIIRSAAAFNYDVILGDNTVDIYNSKVIRSTEGMIFNVNFIKANIIDFINEYNDYKYYVADMNKGLNVKSINNTSKHGIIVGNEGNGISDEIRNINMPYVHIKQSNKCESLNVGVAASIIMHELGDIND